MPVARQKIVSLALIRLLCLVRSLGWRFHARGARCAFRLVAFPLGLRPFGCRSVCEVAFAFALGFACGLVPFPPFLILLYHAVGRLSSRMVYVMTSGQEGRGDCGVRARLSRFAGRLSLPRSGSIIPYGVRLRKGP